MSGELQVFTNPEFGDIRVVEIDNEPWWVLSDVCKVLGLTTPARVAERLDEDEKGVSLIHTPGGNQKMTIVNESGLYNVIIRSDKPIAKSFKRWITHEVIPSIRKTGSYALPQAQTPPLPTDYLSALRALVSEVEKNIELTQQVEELKPAKQYVDLILSSKEALTVTQIAADYGLSAYKLNKILNEERVQRKVNGQWILYHDKMGNGYTDSQTVPITRTDGSNDSVVHTRWTQKGRLFIHNILERRGIKANMDKQDSEYTYDAADGHQDMVITSISPVGNVC